ncbi:MULTISPECIES: Rieske (2Fe-2S) protein [unclassified Gordonia (in: high G+C Gram-positive bacteria)]
MTEHAVARLDEIPPGEGRAFGVGDRQIAVFRLRDDTLRALDAVCPHRGGPLADGLLDARVVVCPLHNHTFDLCTGAETAFDGNSTTSYGVRVDDEGTVHIEIG